jgi:hypothetical protein
LGIFEKGGISKGKIDFDGFDPLLAVARDYLITVNNLSFAILFHYQEFPCTSPT